MKSNTQNTKIEAITETTLVLGIDVGSETHYARAFDHRGIEYTKKPFKFSNNEAGFATFKAWILSIKEAQGKDKVVPGMEPTGHYWFNLGKFLQDNEMKPVLVNPHHVKKSKELDDNNPTKNDRKDPKVIAGLVREGRYMIPYLPDGVYAFYHEYQNLQQLCILILQNEKQQMGLGSNRVFGILFDGAWLWEEYVNLLVNDIFYHPMNKSGKDAQWLFDKKIGKIYPDFIGKDSDNRIIADAKYKPISNIGGKDYLQVLAYMFRFDSKKAFYLYPESGDAGPKELLLNGGSTYEGNVKARGDISIKKNGLRIPTEASTYSEFVDMIRVAENDFKNQLYDI